MPQRLVGELVARVSADTKRFIAGIAGAETALKKFHKSSETVAQKQQKLGSAPTTGLTIPLLGIGAAATKMFMDFEGAFTNIGALVGESSEQIKKYEEQVLEMSRTMPQAPKELAEALYFVTSSGFSGAEAMDVLDASARAAAAGLGETETVADAVTSAVNAYGQEALSAERATDILITTVREGKAEPEELAKSIGRVIAPAQAMGVEFEEVGGALASLSLLGLDAAEATTALRGVIGTLMDPTTTGTNVLKDLGYSIEDVQKSMSEDFLGTLVDLRKKLGDNKTAMAGLFGNVRALNGFLILTGTNAEKTRDIFKALRESTGATDIAFRKASESMHFKFGQAMNAVREVLIKLGGTIAPVVLSIVKPIESLIHAFSDLPGPIKTTIIVLGGLLALQEPLMKFTTGFFNGLNNIGGAVTKMQAAAAMSGQSMTRAAARSATFSKMAQKGAASLGNFVSANLIALPVMGAMALQAKQDAEAAKQIAEGMDTLTASTNDLISGEMTAHEWALKMQGVIEDAGPGEAMYKLSQATRDVAEAYKKSQGVMGDATLNAKGKMVEQIKTMEDQGVELGDLKTKIVVFAGLTMDKFQEWHRTITQKFNGVTSAIERFAGKNKVATSSVINSMKKQLKHVRNYGNNWGDFLKKNYPEELVKQVADMGLEGAGLMSALADANKKETNEIKDLWKSSANEAADIGSSLSDSIFQVKSAFDDTKTSVEDLSNAIRGVPSEVNVTASYKGPTGDGLGMGGGSVAAMARAAMDKVGGDQNISSGFRGHSITASGNLSYHSDPNNPAQDIAGSNLMGIFNYLSSNYGANLRELIYSPAGFGIKNGARVPNSFFGDEVISMHYDHVHVADKGGRFRGPGLVRMGAIDEYVFQPAKKVGDMPSGGEIRGTLRIINFKEGLAEFRGEILDDITASR